MNKLNERAGDGDRTHTTSLEGWDSTIELHPHFRLSICKDFKSLEPTCIL